MINVEQRIIRVEQTCCKTIDQQIDEILSEMNKKGFRLTIINTIQASRFGNQDAHGMSYDSNEKRELIFERVQ